MSGRLNEAKEEQMSAALSSLLVIVAGRGPERVFIVTSVALASATALSRRLAVDRLNDTNAA
jgi:hypothetical protein